MEPTSNSYQPGTDLPMPDNQAGSATTPQNSPADLSPKNPPIQATPPSDNRPATPVAPQPVTSTEPDPIQAIDIAPPAAEDSDLIEQEWVDKAKAIVNSTSHDPHTLNKEINKFKADYIKKRYNKQIKVITD